MSRTRSRQKSAACRQERVREFFKEPGVRIVTLVAFLIIVVLVMILVYMLTRPEVVEKPKIVIDNFAEVLPEVPKKTEQKIEEELYTYVSESVDTGKSVPKSGAMIRKGEADEFAVSGTFHVGDFIVDIDSVKQSYIAEYFYGQIEGMNETEGDASAKLYCIEDPDLVKYPEFKCQANRDFVKPNAISYVLPKKFDGFTANSTYSSTSESGYAVVIEYDPSESVYMSGKVEAFKNEKKKELRDYIEKAGLNPDDYEYIEKFRIVR